LLGGPLPPPLDLLGGFVGVAETLIAAQLPVLSAVSSGD